MTLSEERLREMLADAKALDPTFRSVTMSGADVLDLRAALTELLSLRSDAHTSGEVKVKALEWRELTSPREDGDPEPTGDIEALDHMGDYCVTFDADEEMIETPWVAYCPMESLGHFSSQEDAREACDLWRSKAILSSLVAAEPELPPATPEGVMRELLSLIAQRAHEAVVADRLSGREARQVLAGIVTLSEGWKPLSLGHPIQGEAKPLSLNGFAETLASIMDRRGVTVRGLAETLSIDKSAISRMRTGKPVEARHFIEMWNWVHASPQPPTPAGVREEAETLLIYLRGCLSREDSDGMIDVPADYIKRAIPLVAAAMGAGG